MKPFLAEVVVVIHMGVVLLMCLGPLLSMLPIFKPIRPYAIVFPFAVVATQAAFGFKCPMTMLENYLRGKPVTTGPGFIATFLINHFGLHVGSAPLIIATVVVGVCIPTTIVLGMLFKRFLLTKIPG